MEENLLVKLWHYIPILGNTAEHTLIIHGNNWPPTEQFIYALFWF